MDKIRGIIFYEYCTLPFCGERPTTLAADREQFHLGRFYCTNAVRNEWIERREDEECRKCNTRDGEVPSQKELSSYFEELSS